MNGIIIGIGLVWLFNKALDTGYDALYKALPYEILKTSFTKFTFDEIIIRSEVKITNLSQAEVHLLGFKGSLYYQNQEVSKIQNGGDGFKLQPNQSQNFNLYFGFQPRTLITQIAALMAEKKLFGNFKVVGQLETGQFFIPVSYTPDLLPN